MSKISINGEIKEVPNDLTVRGLLDHFSLPSQLVAIELNKEVVRKRDWEATLVNDGDRVEIVHFVGGG